LEYEFAVYFRDPAGNPTLRSLLKVLVHWIMFDWKILVNAYNKKN